MGVLRWIAGRLSYANVVATLALFIVLGGASYAAVTLPAGSVGARQLRRGALTTGALGFALGATGMTDAKLTDRHAGPCDGGYYAPGEPVMVCSEALIPLGLGSLEGPPALDVSVAHAGHLAIWATLGVEHRGEGGTSASLSYAASIRHLKTGHAPVQLPPRTVTLLGGQAEQTSL